MNFSNYGNSFSSDKPHSSSLCGLLLTCSRTSDILEEKVVILQRVDENCDYQELILQQTDDTLFLQFNDEASGEQPIVALPIPEFVRCYDDVCDTLKLFKRDGNMVHVRMNDKTYDFHVFYALREAEVLLHFDVFAFNFECRRSAYREKKGCVDYKYIQSQTRQ